MRRQEAPMSTLSYFERYLGIPSKNQDSAKAEFSKPAYNLLALTKALYLFAYSIFALSGVLLLVGILIGLKL